MTQTLAQFNNVLLTMGSDATFHREDTGTPCPCRTPEGFRDPAWHRAHPLEPVCNEQGFLSVVNEFLVKAAIQPPQMRGNRGADRVNALLGEVQSEDRIGIFPCTWGGNTLDFDNWSDAGEDFILYDGKRYIVVEAQKLADVDGDPDHHWEVGMRRVKVARPT